MHLLLVAAAAAALAADPAQAPAADGKQIKLASPGLGAVNLKKDRVDFFADHFAQELNNRGVRVITAKEVNAVLGLARTQQLMGCDESSTNCMTELADALGVDGVITGSIGQFGPTYQANLVIASNGDGKLLSSVTVRADSEQQMLEALSVGAKQAASEVGAKLGKPARRFAQQSLYVDVLQLLGGSINLAYARALNPRWSIVGSFQLALDQPFQDYPNVGFTASNISAQVRFHFFDSPPFGLYVGGLEFLTGYGFGTDNGGAPAAVGTSAFALQAEVGYAIALFDFIHLSLGVGGFAGFQHVAGIGALGVANGYPPIASGFISTGLGWAF